ncbi:MAG TPA: methionine adenosyltransferase domain-containing protein [Candidatus Nanoarchaeia archaeon]|nr:methionine adenosyltransferase domain-containing protein [Candidatus Nanoarchaeia archaeon]
MSELQTHSFEAGRRGKPDELDAGIAHLIGAYFLEQNSLSRFDLRVSGGFLQELDQLIVRVSGEISESLFSRSHLRADISRLIVEHYNQVHRTTFPESHFRLEYEFKKQSDGLAANNNAGDSGNPIAVAYRTSPIHFPWERYLAVEIRNLFDTIFQSDGTVPAFLADHSGISVLSGLRADGKIGVDASYDRVAVHGVDQVTLALEHEPSLTIEELRVKAETLVRSYLHFLEKQYDVNFNNPTICVNGLGAWHQGGWKVDEGSREAKSYRDGFSSYGVVEDSFSGEDPSKPSATGTFLARYIAVQVVANEFADFARVALNYTIGREEVGLNITTQDTASIPQTELHQWVRRNIPLRISDTIEAFGLRSPQLYRDIVTASDFFHAEQFPWNKVIHQRSFSGS